MPRYIVTWTTECDAPDEVDAAKLAQERQRTEPTFYVSDDGGRTATVVNLYPEG
jgi:hypothetical protein